MGHILVVRNTHNTRMCPIQPKHLYFETREYINIIGIHIMAGGVKGKKNLSNEKMVVYI